MSKPRPPGIFFVVLPLTNAQFRVSQGLNVGNPFYKRNKNVSFGVKPSSQSSTLNFENDYAKKVKTILNKNIISRYKNSPYSLDNI